MEQRWRPLTARLAALDLSHRNMLTGAVHADLAPVHTDSEHRNMLTGTVHTDLAPVSIITSSDTPEGDR
jgi:hypothetical protein